MASNFQRIIERAKQQGEAKLKIIAPKYSVPDKIASEKTKSSRRSSRRSSSGGTSQPTPTSQPQPTPTPTPTPPPQQSQQVQTQQAAAQSSQQRQRNLAFINRYGTPQDQRLPTQPLRETRFRVGLSEEEKQQPTRQVIKGRFKEVGTGYAKFGIGVTESSVNLFSLFGTQMMIPGEEPKRFKFGGKLGEIRDSPATTGTILGQTQFIAPLVIYGGASFISTARTEGVLFATKETALAFSPFKIRTGSYGALETENQISRLKLDVISTKQTQGAFTFRKTIGQARNDQSVKLISSQVSRGFGSKEFGRATTDIIAPRTTLRAGEVRQGFRAIRTETMFTGARGSGARIQTPLLTRELSGLQTTGTISQTRTILNVISDGKTTQTIFSPFGKTTPGSTGTLLKNQPSYSQFVSGEGNKFLKVGRQSITEQLRVGSLNLRGLELNLPKSTTTFKPGSSGSGIQTSKLALKQLTSPAIISTPKTFSLPKTSSPISVIASLGIKRSPVVVAQPQSTQLFRQKQTPITTTTPIQAVTPTTTTRQISGLIQQPRQRSRSRQRQTPATQQLPAQLQLPKQKQVPAQLQLPKQIQLPRQTQRQFPYSPGRATPLIRPQPTQSRVPLGFILPPISSARGSPRNFFSVLGRRFGKFKVVGTAKTQRGAIFKGRRFATQTLGVTFKVPGASAVNIPGFTTKKRKGEVLFIEKRGRRLKKGTKELPEIQFFKKLKGGKK